MNSMRLRTALLGSGAAIAMIAASGTASADELQDLRSQIEALQNKVTELEAKQADSAGSPNVAPAAAVEAGDKPRSWKLPGTNTSMNIGGYAKLDFIYDFNENPGTTAGTPVPSPGVGAGNIQNQFSMNSQQSRVWFKTWTPTDWGELATHIEGDFFGAGNQTFRLRHAYGKLGPVLAGQTWTNFMDLRSGSETIDFGNTVGGFIRQPQIRYTADFGGGTTLDVAVEDPAVTNTVVAGTSAVAAAGLVSSQNVPDFTARLTHSFSGGHFALAGLARQVGVENGGGAPGLANPAFDDESFGWAIAPSGSLSLGPNDVLGAWAVYSQGGGRYIWGSQNLFDVALTGTTPASAGLDTVETWGGYGWWQHKWTSTIRSNLVGQYMRNKVGDEITKAAIPAATRDRDWAVHANLIWSPVPQVNIGVEYIYRNTTFHNSNNGEVSRIHMGFQYSF